ncbi:MAG TPA: PEP-CTERM sorting domain-containing protein [Burkholderiaceae bacterium]
MIKHFALAAILAAASAAASAAGPNLLLDGDFESTPVAAGGWTTVSATPGWTSTTHGIELRNDAVGVAESGVNFVELDTDQNSSMYQTVTLAAGEYTLSFWVQDRAGTDAATNGLSVSVGGLLPTQVLAGGAYPEWTKVTETFDVGTATTTTLTFAAAGVSDSLGTSLDNVSLTAVPEPSGLVLAASGLALLGLARRRARKA